MLSKIFQATVFLVENQVKVDFLKIFSSFSFFQDNRIFKLSPLHFQKVSNFKLCLGLQHSFKSISGLALAKYANYVFTLDIQTQQWASICYLGVGNAFVLFCSTFAPGRYEWGSQLA